MTVPVLAVRGARKTFGAVEALRGVDLEVGAGEVHALCGDNGAGKSTLVKLVAGVEVPDGGSIEVDGAPARFRSPVDALARGVATIHQDLGLAPRMSVRENVFMGGEIVRRVLGVPVLDRRRMRTEAKALLGRVGVDLTDMEARIERLSGGQRQAVAIARALRSNARLIVMDEPTAALGVRETAVVLDLVRRLRAAGVAVLLVSHAMEDVAAVADRATVLRAGRRLTTVDMATQTASSLAAIIRTPTEPVG